MPFGITFFNPNWPLQLKFIISAFTAGTSILTTFLFHKLMSRYVCEAYILPNTACSQNESASINDDSIIEFISLGILGGMSSRTFKLKDLSYLGKPFVTIKSIPDGRSFLLSGIERDNADEMSTVVAFIKSRTL